MHKQKNVLRVENLKIALREGVFFKTGVGKGLQEIGSDEKEKDL